MFELFSIFFLLALFFAGLLLLRLFFGLGIFAIKLLLLLAFVVTTPVWLPVLIIAGVAMVPLLVLLAPFMLVLFGLKLIF